MFEQFIDKAMGEIWCNPTMDRVSILKPKRISPREGIKRVFSFPWNELLMPNQDDRFYLYQIGHIPNHFLGIFKKYPRWTTLADICNENNLHVDLYLDDGVEFAKSHTFLIRDHLGTLFVAVRYYDFMPSIRTKDLHMRFYGNAFAASMRNQGNDQLIYINGGLIDSASRRLDILNDFYTRRNEGTGYTYLQYNGIEYGWLTPGLAGIGNTMEVLQDYAVKEYHDFKVSDLPTFTSKLDSKAKYLIHQPKSGEDMIDFYDDIDILLFTPMPGDNGEYKGIRYHTNARDAIRMVTHQDYAIPTDYVEEYIANHPDIFNMETLHIRLLVKHSGYNRPLAPNASKTNELYRLDDAEIVKSMIGFNAIIGEWNAAELEASMHTRVYSSMERLTIEQVLEAYGYDASMKYLFNSPLFPVQDGGVNEFKLPIGFWSGCTVYEYDTNGCLIDFHSNIIGPEYYPNSPDCAKIEVHRGFTSKYIDMTSGLDVVAIDDTLNYKFYMLTAHGDTGLDGEWIEAVEDEHYYFKNGNVRWDVDLRLYKPLVVSDAIALGYTEMVSVDAGIVSLQAKRLMLKDDHTLDTPLEIPMGKLDVWLNGHPLIETLDFIIVDGTNIYIHNKEYLLDAEQQKVTIRWMGHQVPSYEKFSDFEVGYVNQGLLSANGKFDVKDDRLTRCIVGGKIVPVEELEFQEEHSGAYVRDIDDGTPYLLEYSKPPLWDMEPYIPDNWREDSLSLNIRIGALLTQKLPAAPLPSVVATDRRYTLYSTFISAIIANIKNGTITVEHDLLTDDEVVSVAVPYLHLLDSDPCNLDLPILHDLTIVHPHPFFTEVNVTLYEYNLLERLSQRFLNNKLDMTQFVSVGEIC